MSTDTMILDGSPKHITIASDDDVTLRGVFANDVSGWSGWFARISDKDGNTWDFGFDLTDIATGVIVMSLTKAQTEAMYGKPDLHWQFRILDDDGLDRTLISSDSRVQMKKNRAVRP